MENELDVNQLRLYLLGELSAEQNQMIEEVLIANPVYFHLLKGLHKLGCQPGRLDESVIFLENAKRELELVVEKYYEEH